MIFFLLFKEFFKIGVFSFGGGYATLPFLYAMAENYEWFTLSELSRMLAISSITPGPVGLNVATFAGFKTAGIFGSITATLAIMIPSFIFVVFISKILKKFKDNFYINSALYALRPATAALIASVCIKLFKSSIFISNSKFDIKGIILLFIFFVLSLRIKKDPLIFLLFGVFAGLLFNLNHIIPSLLGVFYRLKCLVHVF